MAYYIPVYIPNMSTEKLIDLLSNTLDVESSIVNFERLDKGAKFRAPDMAIVLNTDSESFLVQVVQLLIEASRIMGATQFSIEHEGFDMRLRPTNLDTQHIEHLLIASSSFKIDQINIF